MKKVLIVEDDPEIIHLLEIHLKDLGCEVISAMKGDSGLRMAINEVPDLIILDVMLPGMDGVEVCQKIRAAEIKSPILMLTAKSEEIDKVLGLEVGADDYLVKPVKPKLLIARIKAHLRQVESAPSPLRIDLSSRSVEVYGEELKLTTSEFDLLALLASHPGVTLTRQELYHELRGIDYDGLDRSIDLRVSKLRNNLRLMGFEHEVIKTVHGRGYHFVPMNDLCVVDLSSSPSL